MHVAILNRAKVILGAQLVRRHHASFQSYLIEVALALWIKAAQGQLTDVDTTETEIISRQELGVQFVLILTHTWRMVRKRNSCVAASGLLLEEPESSIYIILGTPRKRARSAT